MIRNAILLALLTLPVPAAAEGTGGATASLSIRFEAIEPQKGQLMVSLFDSEAAHDAGGEAVRRMAAPVDGSEVVVRIEGLSPGRYAVRAFHDVDGDGRLATNPFGIPIEPFAFSNGARAAGGPPSWADASFEVSDRATETRIRFK